MPTITINVTDEQMEAILRMESEDWAAGLQQHEPEPKAPTKPKAPKVTKPVGFGDLTEGEKRRKVFQTIESFGLDADLAKRVYRLALSQVGIKTRKRAYTTPEVASLAAKVFAEIDG